MTEVKDQPVKIRKRPTRTPKDGPAIRGGTPLARKQAAVILDVLAGLLKPSAAASFLGISLPRYYLLERRAIEGLVTGCEPLPMGRKAVSEGKEMEKLTRQIKRLEQDSLRYQTLARTAQRTLGLPAAKPAESGKGKRRGKPIIRALKIAEGLRKEATSAGNEPILTTGT